MNNEILVLAAIVAVVLGTRFGAWLVRSFFRGMVTIVVVAALVFALTVLWPEISSLFLKGLEAVRSLLPSPTSA